MKHIQPAWVNVFYEIVFGNVPSMNKPFLALNTF